MICDSYNAYLNPHINDTEIAAVYGLFLLCLETSTGHNIDQNESSEQCLCVVGVSHLMLAGCTSQVSHRSLGTRIHSLSVLDYPTSKAPLAALVVYYSDLPRCNRFKRGRECDYNFDF